MAMPGGLVWCQLHRECAVRFHALVAWVVSVQRAHQTHRGVGPFVKTVGKNSKKWFRPECGLSGFGEVTAGYLTLAAGLLPIFSGQDEVSPRHGELRRLPGPAWICVWDFEGGGGPRWGVEDNWFSNGRDDFQVMNLVGRSPDKNSGIVTSSLIKLQAKPAFLIGYRIFKVFKKS